jgi:predicted CXXCH cytochrome family protein
LTNADNPPPLTREQWTRMRDELRATAYFVIGRVEASKGAYVDARRSLLMAMSLNHDEIEGLYTLGIVQMALGDDANAAAAFGHVVNREDTKTRRDHGQLVRASRDALTTLYARQPLPKPDFEDYVASLRWTPPAAPARAPSPPAGAYAGSNACRECHAPVYQRWQATGMAKMFRAYRPGDVIGDFSSARIISDRARPLLQDGRHFIEIREGTSSRWNRYPVDYVIGSKWQQAYATRLPDSRILVFPIQYNRLKSAWLNYWSVVDAAGSERADISRFHTIPAGAIYQTSCAPCHTSQLKQVRSDPFTFREGGINCEMCHGPSLAHIERIKSGSIAARATHETPIRFGRLPAQQFVAVCGQCHAQSAVHNVGAGGSVNYSEQIPFYRVYPMHLASNFSRKAFYRDGRYRATTFISEAFARSQCFSKGNATCGACHDPHPADAASNPTSLKFRSDPDRMCVQCHKKMADRPDQHTRHARSSDAGRCVSCHMPRIMDALLFPARSHQIDEVPDAEMTARFGNDDSPNACLLCHKDKDVTWLAEELRRFQVPVPSSGSGSKVRVP